MPDKKHKIDLVKGRWVDTSDNNRPISNAELLKARKAGDAPPKAEAPVAASVRPAGPEERPA